MGDRKNPFIEVGFPEYEGIHLMPFGVKERAETHEFNRQRVVVSILLELHLMTLFDTIKKNQAVTLKKAISQSLSGSKSRGTEAAHCAPRQILIGHKTPQDILRKPFAERAWVLDAYFAETDILPANFNKCDSRAERNGLTSAFREACENIIFSGFYNGKVETGAIAMSLANAYSLYESRAKIAFESCIDRLREKLQPFGLPPADKAKWNEQLVITQEYARILKEGSGKAETMYSSKIEGLITIYKKFVHT